MTEQMTPDEVLAVLDRTFKYAREYRAKDDSVCPIDHREHLDDERKARTAVAVLIAREAAYRNALEHIAGSCEGRAAEVASVALKFAEASHG